MFLGYKINNAKSSVMMLKEEERRRPTPLTSFNAAECFTYLDICIVPQIDHIVSANYDPSIDSITKSIDRWSSLPMYLIGRINILNMNVLPKLLYLFQNIPLLLPPSLFTKLKKMLTVFIWNNKYPRVRLSLLYLPFDRFSPCADGD